MSVSQRSSCSDGRALTCGKAPITPARHSAVTRGGKETRNIGAPIAGTASVFFKALGRVIAGLARKRCSTASISPRAHGTENFRHRIGRIARRTCRERSGRDQFQRQIGTNRWVRGNRGGFIQKGG